MIRVIALFVLCIPALCCAGCSAFHGSHREAEGDGAMMNQIEFLYFEGCPNHVGLRESLDAALVRIDRDAQYTAVDLTTLDELDRRLRWGSPTILVGGVDLFDQPPASEPSMTCRIYPGGTPDADDLVRRLSAR